MERRLVKGLPAAEILRVANESGCDLIMMGTHGLSGLAHLFMGSVAELVMRKAPCPVLTVKAPAASREKAPAATDRQRDAGPRESLANANRATV